MMRHRDHHRLHIMRRRATHSLSAPIALIQAAGKQFRHIAEHKLLAMRSRHLRPGPWPVYFFPEMPHPYTVCYRTLHHLGVAPQRSWPTHQRPGIAFVWKDDTFVPALTSDARERARGSVLINDKCLDISKARVNAVHQQVLGYSLAVDPTTYTGRMVVKSNLNGEHDGQEVVGPVSSPLGDAVYQRVVNNRPTKVPPQLSGQDVVCDIRVAIFGGRAGFAYLKYRPVDQRFSNTNSLVELASLTSVFSAPEVTQIESYCQSFGLDYGEIDVVRDSAEKQIFILDINKTPLGPPNGLPDAERKKAQQMYCHAFSAWLSRLGRQLATSAG